MITDKKELFRTKVKAVVVDKSLVQSLWEESRMPELEPYLEKDKPVFTERFVKEIKSFIYKKNRKGVGGRPRIEEKDPSKLKGKKLQRYKYRIYKRRSRERKRLTDEVAGQVNEG